MGELTNEVHQTCAGTMNSDYYKVRTQIKIATFRGHKLMGRYKKATEDKFKTKRIEILQ